MKLKTEDQIIEYIKKCIKVSDSHVSEWETRSRENYDFFAGKQWEQEDQIFMLDNNRVPITFNRVARTINAISGLELENRQDIKYLPRQLQDAGLTDTLNATVKWVRDQADAEDEESEAFQDTLICGYGWTETYICYDDDPEGNIVEIRVDPLEMRWDPSAKKRNLEDARYIFQKKKLSRSELDEMGFDVDLIFPEDDDAPVEPHDATLAKYYAKNQGEEYSEEKKYEVIRFQWYEKVDSFKVKTKNSIEQISEDVFESLAAKSLENGMDIDQRGIQYYKQKQKIFREVFYANGEILNRKDAKGKIPYAAPINNFNFRCVTGLLDRNKNLRFGVMDLMRDPQKWYNKWLSQTLRILNSNAKGGLYAERGAFADTRKAEMSIAKENSIVELNDGGLRKIMPKEPPQMPKALGELIQISKEAITDTPGLSLEILGVANRNQPSSLEEQRRESGVTILATFFKSMRRYRKAQGRVLYEYIKNYLSDGRMIRIVGRDGVQYVPLLLNTDQNFKFDVIVDEAPTSPNMKQRTFEALKTVLPMALQAGTPIPPEVLDYMPLPQSLIEAWKEEIAKPSQPDPMAQRLKQIQMMLAELSVESKKLENEEKASKAELNKAQAYESFAQADNEEALAKQKTGMDLMKIANEQSLKNQEFVAEQARKEQEFNLNQRQKLASWAIDQTLRKSEGDRNVTRERD